MYINQNKKVKFLEDEPKNIENSPIVAAILNELSSTQGKIIGLLGSWGSGKSSIIKSLEKESKYLFLQYDAWKNEGFPFKIGFLQFIYDSLIKDKGKEYLEIKEELDELEKVKDKTREVEYSILNFENSVIAFSLLFYSLAFDMIINGKTSLYDFKPDLFLCVYNLELLKISLGSSLFLFFINFLFLSEKEKVEKNINIDKFDILNYFYHFSCLLIPSLLISKFFNSISAYFILLMPLFLWFVFNYNQLFKKILGKKDTFGLFSGTKPKTEKIITINKSPEPSFVDFERIYSKVIDEFLNKSFCRSLSSFFQQEKEKRQVVIVIDNIDRIEPDEAQNIWSCLRGMVLKNKNVNVIIPIDEKQVSEIYKKLDYSVDDDKTYSFIQKTFDIIFRVPTCVITKEVDIWNDKLDEAFASSLSKEDKDKIISIFESRNDVIENVDFKKSVYAGSFTPRKVIKLINEVISLEKISLFSNISVVTKFAYSLFYENIRSKFQKGEISNLLPQTNNILIEISKEKQAELAALYFVETPEIALSFVKEEDLYKQISSTKNKISISEMKSSWIWSLIRKILIKKTNLPFSILVNILNNLRLLSKENPSEDYKYLQRNTNREILGLENIDKLDKNTLSILNNSFETETRENQLKLLKLILNDNNTQDNILWLDILLEYISKFKITNDEIYENIDNYIPVQRYKEIIPIIQKDGITSFDSYILDIEEKEYANIFSGLSQDELIYHLVFIIENRPKKEYIDQWNKKMDTLVFPNIQKNISDIRMYSILSKALSLKTNDKIKKFVSENSFLYKILTIQDPSAQGIISAIFCSFATGSNLSIVTSNQYYHRINSINFSYVENFVKTYLLLHNNYLLSLFNLPFIPQTKKIHIDYAIKNCPDIDIDYPELIKNYNKYYSLNSNIETLFEDEINVRKLANGISFTENNTYLLYYLSYKYTILNVKNAAKEFLNQKSLSPEQWMKEIDNYSILFKIAINVDYSENSFKSVRASITGLLKRNPEKFFSELKNELSALSKLDKKIFFINSYLNDNLKNVNVNSLISNFSDSVVKWLNKTNNDENTVYVDFIHRVNDEKWLIKNSSTIKKYLNKEENSKAFYDKWKSTENIINAYKETFEKFSFV